MTHDNGGNTLVDHIEAHRQQMRSEAPIEERSAAQDDPKPISDVAADAVDYCARAAELLRSQANSMKSLAATIETEALALAIDIEKRAERFATMVQLFSAVTGQMRQTFESERERLDGFEIPEAEKARR